MLRKYFKQQLQSQGEVLLQSEKNEFRNLLQQRIQVSSKQDMEILNHSLLEQAETQGFIGWVGNDDFIIRPVGANKQDPMNRFIIEGSMLSDDFSTRINFLIRPDIEGRIKGTFILWSALLVVGALAAIWAIQNPVLVFLCVIFSFVFILQLITITIRPYLPDCKAHFEKMLRSLDFRSYHSDIDD